MVFGLGLRLDSMRRGINFPKHLDNCVIAVLSQCIDCTRLHFTLVGNTKGRERESQVRVKSGFGFALCHLSPSNSRCRGC